ncbi:MAG: long-chain fatty acid--CoA ligase [Robiginitomaculum sp.]|nr:MAG: long-chain fatty acid--CoA ligase [Robiginitomaculum sp.]
MIKSESPFLPEIFALHGKWRAHRPALIADGQSWNWGDFNANLNRVANGLLDMKLAKGTRVILLMGNGVAMVECLFGIMKAGLVSAPLNTSVSDEAILNMIIDSGAQAIIASADQAQRIDVMAASLPATCYENRICAQGLRDAPRDGWRHYESWRDAQDADEPDIKIDNDDMLNIIYSSGTTGQPKGIVHTHQGRRDWAYDLSIALRYHGASRFMATIGLYSNISWVGMLCSLMAGGTLILNGKFDAQKLWPELERLQVTHLAMVPVMYQHLIDVPEHANYDVSSMIGMMSAGSPLHEHTRTAMFARFPCGITELYGLTEGVITTLDPEDSLGRMSSVGLPLIGTDLKILDENDQDCPNGKAGEIVSRGRIVMPRYLNRDEATRESIYEDGLGRQWLRTGDIGYLDAQGYLYIVDRKKDMVLSGGQNIYPQDIEAVLITHPDIEDVAVIGVKSKKWGETPMGVVVMKNSSGSGVSAQTLREWCNARLGKQQRLSGLEITDVIPRNANGKILKHQLRDIYKDVVYD